ncbi:MAG: pseudaminic acid synthase [Candidatus Acidiferrales bacterium]
MIAQTIVEPILIGDRRIGPGESVYVIAELSANHHQDFEQAVRLVHAAKESGADAVKLQTYTPDTMTLECANEHFRIGEGTIWKGRYLHELYGEACTPWGWQPKLKAIANDLGLDLFSTAFDFSSVEFLERMSVPAYKIASFELVDLPLLRRVAATGKPVILSTGMATLDEIQEAVRTLRSAGNRLLALLKCTSAYPAAPEEMNLRTIGALGEEFGVPTGLSDHTLGIAVPVAAAALGASILEKHLTLSRSTPGPDSSFSLEPEEFRAMVNAVREAEKSLGNIYFGPRSREDPSLAFRRSLFVVEDMKAGDIFNEQNVRSIRPGTGLHTRHAEQILGRHARVDIPRGTPLSWSLVASAKSRSA